MMSRADVFVSRPSCAVGAHRHPTGCGTGPAMEHTVNSANTVHAAKLERAPFGTLLLRLRAAAGLTQEQLALRAGLSPDAISALESGKRRTPRFATVELLVAALTLDGQQRDELVAAARSTAGGAEGGVATGQTPTVAGVEAGTGGTAG